MEINPNIHTETVEQIMEELVLLESKMNILYNDYELIIHEVERLRSIMKSLYINKS